MSKFVAISRRIAGRFARAVGLRRRNNERHPFDIKYGTDTSGVIDVSELGLPENRRSQAVRYQSAISDVYEEMLTCLKIDFNQYAFVDIGSGKGRALLLASRFRFKRLVGVELSKQLHDIAITNVAKFKTVERCDADIECICGDATEFVFPALPLVVYLFNPFSLDVMEEVASNLQKSIETNPRPIYVLYLKPLHRSAFLRRSIFSVVLETERYLILFAGNK